MCYPHQNVFILKDTTKSSHVKSFTNETVKPDNVRKRKDDDSHDEDGGGDEGGGEEASVTVGVLPLPLMHLASAVVAASTHAEARGDDGREDHEHDAGDGAYQEPGLVMDPLNVWSETVNQCLLTLPLISAPFEMLVM